MDKQARALAIFAETEALLEGHFLLSSGRHSDKYMQCAKVFQYPDKAGELCAALASLFANAGINVVVGPAVGAVQMAYEVSRHLNCRNLYTERNAEGKMELRRGFELPERARVLVVEDTITTGGTVREVMGYLLSQGAFVAGVGSLVDRSGGAAAFDVPFFHSVSRIDRLQTWEAEACPLCAQGSVPFKPGSRK
jgi:orotate phosphoribosyltransferase